MTAPPAACIAASRCPATSTCRRRGGRALGGRGLLDRRDIGLRMTRAISASRSRRGLPAREHVERLLLERTLDGAHAVGALGMAGDPFHGRSWRDGSRVASSRRMISVGVRAHAPNAEHCAIRAASPRVAKSRRRAASSFRGAASVAQDSDRPASGARIEARLLAEGAHQHEALSCVVDTMRNSWTGVSSSSLACSARN